MNFNAIKTLLNSDKLIGVDYKFERSWKTHIFVFEDKTILTIATNKNFLNGKIIITYGDYKDERNSIIDKWILQSMIFKAFNNFFDKVVEKHKNG